ncbi:protein phosphatase 1, regulatory subunit 13Ba isoform X4 [Clupea harengus]|uniref:Protein phosphatase 1, regulatory subunit 13Ba isoform X4 n=1 Tax=Clupea harengus TaxID=7950 RepID=A0A6P3VVR8_CLUHA|nr:protein phosphatase 1, regulatory subunit 13Ba isoform X4 [Clupea harengus]
MKRFLGMVLSSLAGLSKDKPIWLQPPQQRKNKKTAKKGTRLPGKEDRKGPTAPPVRPPEMILTVFLSDSDQMLTEVPITPETLCKDVVEFCKETGESSCHLAEVWRGNERAIPYDHLMYDHLQKWGPRRHEVKFYLRHEDLPIEACDPGSQQSGEQPNRRGRGSPADNHCENGVGNSRVELTLSELQEMASRQQQQIEAQQQMLVAKEQRLRYLKHQDGRPGQSVPEAEKLQRLKERVDSQEAKLKKVRAMRGQVDYSKIINGNLSAEIEHVSSLFQEKQVELQSAVLKVDQLTQQLDDLRRGRLNGLQPLGGPISGAAALELRKLYQELQIRNKLNQDQSSKLQQQKDLLNKRNMEVSMMDKRIGDLRERLYKKKAEARLPQPPSLNRMNGPPSPQPAAGSSGRVAAVCPYIQVPMPGRQEGGYAFPPDPLKPQSLSMTATVNHARSKSAEEEGFGGVRKPLGPWKVSDLDLIADPSLVPPAPEEAEGPGAPTDPAGAPTDPAGADCDSTNDASWPALTKSMPPLVPPDKMAVGMQGDKNLDSNRLVGAVTALSKQPHSTYGTYPSAGHHPTICSTSSLPRSAPATLAWQRSPPTSRSASQQIQQRISVPPSPSSQVVSPMFPGERPDPPLAAAVRPFVTDRGARPQSPRKGPATMNSSSIYHMYLQPAAKGYPSSSRPAVRAVYGKPVLPSSSTSPSPIPFQHQSSRDEPDAEGSPLPPPSVENIPRPLSPTKLTPVAHSPMRYQSDADLEVLRRKLVNAPRPLKKRSSITEPEGPAGPNIQKLLYQRFNTLAGGMEGSAVGTPFYQPDSPLSYMGPPMILSEDDSTNGNAPVPDSLAMMPPAVEVPTHDAPLPPPSRSPPSSDANENRLAHPSINTIPSAQIADAQPSPQMSRLALDTTEDNSNNNHRHQPGPTNAHSSPVPEACTPPAVPEVQPQPSTPPSPSAKRTNLKKPGSERTGHGLRVKFNPLALLLDASLEGEFDLVQRIIYEVRNPSTPNDEGITPLHNAVCAGHHHIVKFLLDFGVNVNAADSDGWTPLHCAASCNSVHLCKLLVESGAAIFATTISDVETAADKCEEMEEGYIQCSQFLYGVQEKLGVMNKGSVYALWDYEAQSGDELCFHEGDALTVLRRRDDSETEWWWARLNDKEGYVPRNLLGLYPRIKPRQRSLA